MKLKQILLIFFLLFFLKNHAQNTPVNKVYGLPLDTLKKMVTKHPRYFKHLKNKWVKEPQKMTSDEMMLLYYGSCFLPDYQPVKEDKAVAKIAGLLGEMDFENALIEGKKLLTVYPLNARLNMLLGYAAKKTGQKRLADYYYKNYADLLRIPLYSGTGQNYEHGFVVRLVSDEYLILNQKDLELVEQAVRYYQKIPFDEFLVHNKLKDNKPMQTLPKQKLYMNIYLPFFVGQHKNFEMVQDEAKRKYKIK